MTIYTEPICSWQIFSPHILDVRNRYRRISHSHPTIETRLTSQKGIWDYDSAMCLEGTYMDIEKQENIKKLHEIAKLPYNWNENCADSFSPQVISECLNIVDMVPRQPEIFPTAAESIQMEYEKEDGEYLEFNIFENHIEVFGIGPDGTEKEAQMPIADKGKIQQMVMEFYG